MNMIKFVLGTFRARITLVLILSMLFCGVVSNLLISKFALDSQFEQLRKELMVIAQTSALLVDPGLLSQIPLTHAGEKTRAYRIISEKLDKVRKLNPTIKYIYVMTRTDAPGTWQFVVDPTMSEEDVKKGLSSLPGDKYDAKRFPEMLKAYDGPAADKKIDTDEWGALLSGYAPVRNDAGKTVAVLGVDISADDVYLARNELWKRTWLVLFIGILISVFLGIIISKGIADPVKRLVEGTRSIVNHNLEYHVDIDGPDEILELAAALNRMSDTLKESRDNLRNYFYKVAQALIRVLEEKDEYTKGHSERVAAYTEKIAVKLGFSKERIDFLKEAALLHDIGKLGIEADILNKKGKLTDKEWKKIVRHPVVGEEILRPVFLQEEMLTVTRRHHEKFDGTGYPDKLAGDSISVLAQVVSVADAYDAMTSTRAYRPAMSKKKAMEELRRKKDTQFNPWLVEIFIEILENEDKKR
ncbi:MAG: HD domain-containing phosphohydrolase [Elusimicrobiota bacterium]